MQNWKLRALALEPRRSRRYRTVAGRKTRHAGVGQEADEVMHGQILVQRGELVGGQAAARQVAQFGLHRGAHLRPVEDAQGRQIESEENGAVDVEDVAVRPAGFSSVSVL